MNPARIEIVEVGPRDGLQSESQVLPTATKSGIHPAPARRRAGAHRGSKLRQSEAGAADGGRRSGAGVAWRIHERRAIHRPGAQSQGLRARAGRRLHRGRHGHRRQRELQPAQPGLQRGRGLDGLAGHRQAGAQPPAFAPRSPSRRPSVVPSRARCRRRACCELAERVAAGRPDEIAVADTIGVAVPTQVTELIGRLRERMPQVRLRAHFHNTRNTGLANAYAAVQAGVQALDASCGGIGGCPFAPAATGNIPTEDLIYMLHRDGRRDRRGPAGAARDQPLAAADARSFRAGHAGEGGAVSDPIHGTQGG